MFLFPPVKWYKTSWLNGWTWLKIDTEWLYVSSLPLHLSLPYTHASPTIPLPLSINRVHSPSLMHPFPSLLLSSPSNKHMYPFYPILLLLPIKQASSIHLQLPFIITFPSKQQLPIYTYTPPTLLPPSPLQISARRWSDKERGWNFKAGKKKIPGAISNTFFWPL